MVLNLMPLLDELGQKRPRWHDQRSARLAEAISIDVIRLDLDLEGKGRVELVLEHGEGRRRAFVPVLHFNQEPGTAVADDDEVHLPLALVAQVAEGEFAQAEIGPALDLMSRITKSKDLRQNAETMEYRVHIKRRAYHA